MVCAEKWCRIVEKPGWEPRARMAGVVMEALNSRGRIVEALLLLGGRNAEKALDDAWASENGGTVWTQQSNKLPFGGREAPALAVVSGSLLVLAGGVNGGRLYNDVWISPDVGVTWSLLQEAAPWTPRAGHCFLAAGPERGALLLGGFDGQGDLAEAWEFEYEVTAAARRRFSAGGGAWSASWLLFAGAAFGPVWASW